MIEPGTMKAMDGLVHLTRDTHGGVDFHARDARAQGKTEHRLCAVPVWRQAPFFGIRNVQPSHGPKR